MPLSKKFYLSTIGYTLLSIKNWANDSLDGVLVLEGAITKNNDAVNLLRDNKN